MKKDDLESNEGLLQQYIFTQFITSIESKEKKKKKIKKSVIVIQHCRTVLTSLPHVVAPVATATPSYYDEM